MADTVIEAQKIGAREILRRIRPSSKTIQRVRNFAIWGVTTYFAYKGFMRYPGTLWIAGPLAAGTLAYAGSVALKEDEGIVKGAIIYTTAVGALAGLAMWAGFAADRQIQIEQQAKRPATQKSFLAVEKLPAARS